MSLIINPTITYPNWPKCRPVYRFDPTWYIGAADEVKLINDVKRSLVGVNYFLDNKYDTDQYRVVRLVCSFSKKLKKATTYKDDCFMKVGTKMEPLKGRGMPTFDRLHNAKLKSNKNTSGLRSAAKKGGETVIKKKGKSQKHIQDTSIPHLRRTVARQPTCSKNKCKVVLSLLMSYATNEWYLSSKGCLDHILHVQKHAVYQTITPNDFDDSEQKLLNLMFKEDLTPSVIGRVMESLRIQKGKVGQLRPRSLSNAAQKHRDAIDLAHGIEKDWTIAQKTLAKLEVMGVSYYALMFDKKDRVFAHKSKGRPTLKQAEEIKIHGKLKSELRQLRKDFSMNNHSEILLSLSIADDDMQRAVHMFPEVFYMDVIANTNRQKRDLFVLVIKDASGETHIGNASILPCGKLWIFSMVYEKFFLSLYGETTLSRLRLALTDDDTSSHSSFDAATKIVKSLSSAKHMLCVFHAVTMRYQDLVYGHLPKRRDGKTLTEKGALYGEPSLSGLWSYCVFAIC